MRNYVISYHLKSICLNSRTPVFRLLKSICLNSRTPVSCLLNYDSNCVRNTSENSISTLEFTTAAVEALPTSTDPPSTE